MPPRPIQPTRGRSLGAWDSETIVRASVNQDGSSTLPTVAAAEDFSKSRRVVLRMDRLSCKEGMSPAAEAGVRSVEVSTAQLTRGGCPLQFVIHSIHCTLPLRHGP